MILFVVGFNTDRRKNVRSSTQRITNTSFRNAIMDARLYCFMSLCSCQAPIRHAPPAASGEPIPKPSLGLIGVASTYAKVRYNSIVNTSHTSCSLIQCANLFGDWQKYCLLMKRSVTILHTPTVFAGTGMTDGPLSSQNQIACSFVRSSLMISITQLFKMLWLVWVKNSLISNTSMLMFSTRHVDCVSWLNLLSFSTTCLGVSTPKPHSSVLIAAVQNFPTNDKSFFQWWFWYPWSGRQLNSLHFVGSAIIDFNLTQPLRFANLCFHAFCSLQKGSLINLFPCWNRYE